MLSGRPRRPGGVALQEVGTGLPAVLNGRSGRLVHQGLAAIALAHDEAGDRPDASRSGSIRIHDFWRTQIRGQFSRGSTATQRAGSPST
jgi:hypothetical protein